MRSSIVSRPNHKLDELIVGEKDLYEVLKEICGLDDDLFLS